MTQPTALATRAGVGGPLRRWLRARSWRWWAACWLILGISEFAAIFAQMDSKTHVVAPSPSPGQQVGSYDAGWPITYAHVRVVVTSFNQWRHLVTQHPPAGQITPFWLIVDVAWTGVIFALGVGLPVIAWAVARGGARGLPRGRFTRVAAICSAIIAAWYAVAAIAVSNINAGQPTDDAAWAQLTHPLSFVALFPGVLSFVVQRGFEGDGGLGIAQSNGPSSYVELGMVILVAVVLPAGILTALTLAAQRQFGRTRRPPTTQPEMRAS